MKIFYAVQATGNGHISRAMELLPYLQRYGTVDIFLSGNNSHLAMDAPVRYRSKGLSLQYNYDGGLNYWNILRGFQPLQLWKEINDIPVEKYDLVINDFEFITAAACARKRVPSIQCGHQASFQSPSTPRPASKNLMGEFILKYYSRSTNYIGLHFDRYDDFVFYPVIKKDIANAEPTDKGYITVYLPAYSDIQIQKILAPFKELPFQVFSKNVCQPEKQGNITFLPVSRQRFNESLINCTGIITGAGFETPAEALHLGKKILAIPVKGQYEQQCNAAALEKIGVTCLAKVDDSFPVILRQWLEQKNIPHINYTQSVSELIEQLFLLHEAMKSGYDGNAPQPMYGHGNIIPA